MQFLAFHNLVKQFLNRKDLTDDQIDFFINTALRELQLQQPLNFTRKSAAVTYPSTPNVGVALDGASGADPAFRALAGDYAVSFMDSNGVAIPLQGDSFVNVQRRIRWNNPPNSLQWPQVNVSLLPISQQTIVYYTSMLSGVNTLFLWPEVASAPLVLFYHAWITEYNWSSGATREDWLLKYGNQALLWGAIEVNNRFQAEDARIPIDQNQSARALDAILREDANIPTIGAAINLD